MVANAPADGRLLAEYSPQSPILRAELSVAAKRPDEMNSVASLDPQAPPHVETANAPAAPGRRCPRVARLAATGELRRDTYVSWPTGGASIRPTQRGRKKVGG
jgi:hypothetical protein